ncbi:MAG: hypothetical protein PGN24_03670 [Microbacterium arborescens]
MGGELGIKAGEHWAYREHTRHPLAHVVVLNPGRNYYDVIRVRYVDDPAHRELETRRIKLPCKWDDLDAYLDAHPEVPRAGEVAAIEPIHIVHTTNELRAIIHEEVRNALGFRKVSYTYDEASTAVGVSEQMLRNAVHRSELVPSYIGTKPVFTFVELLRWVESLPNEPWRPGRLR